MKNYNYTPSLEATARFIASAAPFMSWLTSSFTCQLIFVITTTSIIHRSFTHSLQAQNLPFWQILRTLLLFLPWQSSTFTITGPDLPCFLTYHASWLTMLLDLPCFLTYHASWLTMLLDLFLVRFCLIFLSVPCGGLLLLLVCVSFTIIGQPWNSVLIRRV